MKLTRETLFGGFTDGLVMRTKIKPIDPLVEFQIYIPAAAAYRLVMADIVAEIIKVFGSNELLQYTNIDNVGRLFNAFDSHYFDRERATSFLKSERYSTKGIEILKRLYQNLDANENIVALKMLYQKAGNMGYADDILFIIENKIRNNRKLYLAEIAKLSNRDQQAHPLFNINATPVQISLMDV
jgi:hypothetical protein